MVLRDRHPQSARPPTPRRSTRRSWSASPPPSTTSASTATPREIYVRTTPDDQAVTTSVDSLLGAQASPENPGQVTVSQPSAALTAQADAKGALDTLFLGLGAVALLVGAIGVANIMVISVLERRSEIGLRRALGATRGQIRAQFLAEAILLSLAGGATGVIIGAAATAAYARRQGLRPSSSPPKPGPAAWPPPSSSAPSPGCCPPSAPPACPLPRPSGASEVPMSAPCMPGHRGKPRAPCGTAARHGPRTPSRNGGFLYHPALGLNSGNRTNSGL